VRKERELTFGEQFVMLCRDLSSFGLPLLDGVTGLTGKGRKLIKERDEMILGASVPQIEDIARNIVISFPRFASDKREWDDKSMLEVVMDRRDELEGEVLRDEV